MNQHYRFYVKYYDKIGELTMVNKNEEMNLEIKTKKSDSCNNDCEDSKHLLDKLNNYIKDLNLKIINQKYIKSNENIVPMNQYFCLETTYPGLLLGLGNDHESGISKISNKTSNDKENEHITEIKLGFGLDYVTGLPFIPGTTVKGMLRSAFINYPEYVKEVMEGIGIKKKLNIKELEYEIFGDKHPDDSSDEKYSDKQCKRNSDVFFDAVVIDTAQYEADKGKILGLENITPHRVIGDKYDNLKEINPITLLKVLPGVKFLFRFNLYDGCITLNEKLKLFKEIILDLGIGAKTNTGFGGMKPIENKDINSFKELIPIGENVCQICGKPVGRDKNGNLYEYCHICNQRKSNKK